MNATQVFRTSVAALTALMLAGCAGGGDGGSTRGEADAGASAALIELANERVAEYSTMITDFPAGSTAFDPGSGSAVVISCGSASPACAAAGDNAVDALNEMGWEAPPYVDGQFSAQVESAALDRAVNDGVDGVVLISIDLDNIRSSAERAIAAGVPLICVSCANGDRWPDGVTDITPDWEQQGEMAGWAVLADGGEGTNTVTLADAAFSSSVLRSQGLVSAIEDNCETCSVESIDFPSTSNGKPGPPEWSAELAANPAGTIDYAVGHYDGMTFPMAVTAEQAGRSEIRFGGYDGEQPNYNAIVDGSLPIYFTVAYPYTYMTWAAADALGRIVAGEPLADGLDAYPSMLVEAEQVPDLLVGNPPPSTYPAPEGDWQLAFKQLWGTA